MARRGLGAGVITLIVVDVVLIVVLIALLITHPSDPTETGEAPADPAGASAAPAPTEDETEAQEPGTPVDLDAALEPPEDALSETVFATPSRNIWCQIETRVTCTIGYHTYAPPEPSTECAGTLGRVAHLTEDEATMPCITGQVATSAPPEAPDLDYGQSTVADGFWCTSEESGLTCASVQTGTGFTLAVAEFDTF